MEQGTLVDGRYEIREQLGAGGMGAVYRAWQRSVEREVAIKVMRLDSDDPMAVRRFEREALLASQLAHPNTVSVFDFGKTPEGELFIAMELIRGRTLREVLRSDGRFDLVRIIRVGTQLCDALEAAHQLGIIHRDLKLENIVIVDVPRDRDLLKVLDFGLAKRVRRRDDAGSSTLHTAQNLVVGTPHYIAPEVVVTGGVEPANDIYALGVVLAELATGRPLWGDGGVITLMSDKLDPDRALAGIDPRLRDVLDRLLYPNPDKRPTAARARTLLSIIELGTPKQPPNQQATSEPRVRPSWLRRAWSDPWVRLGLLTIPIVGLAIANAVLQPARNHQRSAEIQQPPASRCPTDFIELPGQKSRYKLFAYSADAGRDQRQGFVKAVQTCAALRAHVAIADDATEARALALALSLDPRQPLFLDGVTDSLVEGTWLAVTGASNPYLPWADNQPDGAEGSDGDCAVFDPDGRLYDFYCDEKHPYPFACECAP